MSEQRLQRMQRLRAQPDFDAIPEQAGTGGVEHEGSERKLHGGPKITQFVKFDRFLQVPSPPQPYRICPASSVAGIGVPSGRGTKGS